MLTVTKMFVQVFFNAWYTTCIFTRVRSVTMSPIAKSLNCLTYILYPIFFTKKEINQVFLHTVKFMINFVSFSCTRTGKLSFSLKDGQIYKLDLLQSKDPTDLSTGCNLALTKELLIFLELMKEFIGPGVERCCSYSFIYHRYNLS